MRILGIETSCDETAAAVAQASFDEIKILSNIVASSEHMHSKTGGIIPENAARAQVSSIMPVIEKALEVASIDPRSDIDAIAVTHGPGLIGSLLVGVETAKTLSHVWDKPIIPVNHLVAHLYANFIDHPDIQFPAIGLVVSGGHTDLVLMRGPSADSGQAIKWLGGTRDDAAGEAFDKTARIIGLGYPGGPAVAAEAAKLEARNLKFKYNLFPRPMIHSDNFDFSFSGLKTAVLNYTSDKLRDSSTDARNDTGFLAANIQQAIVDVLTVKSIKAVKKFKPKSFLLSGGVAANKLLRKTLKDNIGKQTSAKFFVPEIKYCTDNAAMIAVAAFYNQKKVNWQDVTANPELTIASRV